MTRSSRRALLGAVVILAACRAPAGHGGGGGEPSYGDEADGDAAAGGIADVGTDATDGGRAVSAVLATSYRGRFGDGRDDHDVTELAILDVGDPRTDAWTGHALGVLSYDLDGSPDDGDSFAFQSLSDTYDSRLTGRLNHLYVDAHRVPGFDVLRAGRQLVYDTPETLHFDGLRAERTPIGEHAWRFGAYGGVPTLPYESSRAGDWLAGVFAEAAPTPRTTVRADWLHVQDGDQLGDDSDDLLQLAGRWRPDPGVTLETSHSRLGREARDWRAGARVFDVERDLALEASYYELLTTQGELAVPFDPFYATLFELDPYREAGVTVSKGVGDAWLVQAGAEARRLESDADDGPHNREWSRWFVTTSAEGLLPGEVALGVTAEVWDGDGDRYETWGLDLARRFDGGWSANAGSYFSLFKYSFYLDEERERVRTWYAGVRRRITDSVSWRLRYELEHNDFDDFHTLRAGVTWEL